MFLDVEGAKVNDAGVAHLRRLSQLRRLSLNSTAITDAGLEHLSILRQLRELKLNKTKVSAAAVQKLSAALPQCKIDSDHGTFGPSTSADPDRRAAEWVLSVGGAVAIQVGGG
jgi:hypothetical protein